MTNTDELEKIIASSGLKKEFIAEQLGITAMSLYNKINNIREFKASEIQKLSDILKIKDKHNIFFFES